MERDDKLADVSGLVAGPGAVSRAQRLLNWYFANARDLPWRESHDPYRIWLSEVMLQQTQVVTVIAYFLRFVARFPTVQALAAADEEEVLKLWEGLGYYSRARRLIPCARAVVERHGGIFPESLDALLKLPGVGPYTAGAVLSIAYNQRVPAIDGNVLRVASRWYALETDIRLPAAHKAIEERLMAEMPEDARHFNQALMELGACVCTPKNPACGVCPVAGDCEALRLGLVGVLPYKSKAKAKVESEQAVAYITCGDLVMIEKRPPEALLGSLWGFPVVEASVGDSHAVGAADASVTADGAAAVSALTVLLESDYGLALVRGTGAEADADYAILGTATHVFTHKVWRMKLVALEAEKPVATELPETRWVRPSELKDYALPTAFKKLLKAAGLGD
ncbi:A/G-specific adenine glycosylase [Acidaminobacter hydrogenoformans]|uniref:Adenine DNA glycosylase n=1 Tax=Acidaminobacter hydrogenoformans DSM 2784 TaxID=1120920 RepID=A0A1G5RSZ3_9FIRM|nr:A/G-specific adenine glycosylase [Acidaminobacter hydrogenoformans]SCZ76429.1 A/G-specific DNA-adenine glycosylase [Acidaminobacter hydrogenoformans DSM 2784]